MLFYTHQGTFEDNNLVVTCQDIFPMDLGTSGWTEFKMNEDVAAYMADNIELFDCETGLVHSHHILTAFFSSQDNLMLQQEGEDTNCFVSLVVDTRGQYVARITRKIQTKSEVTVKNLGKSYEFFGEGPKEITHDGTEVTKQIDKTVIEYFDMEVERHEVQNNLSYLDARFADIEKRKQQNKVASPDLPWIKGNNNSSFQGFADYRQEKLKQSEYKEQSLFKEEELNNLSPSKLSQEDEQKIKSVSYDWTPTPKKIDEAILHILTCSFITSPKGFDLKTWVQKYMDKVYTRVFGENPYSTPAFDEWKDFAIQFTLDYYDEDNIPYALVTDTDALQSIVAEALIDKLYNYIEDNPYVKEYCDTLEQYIIL